MSKTTFGMSGTSAENGMYTSATNGYQNAINQYTGNAGYQNSVQQGKIGAGIASAGAQAQARTGARNAGMSKGQSAAMGQQTGASSYLTDFTSERQAAAQQGANQVNSYGTLMSSASAEGQNAYNRNIQNFSNNTFGLGTIFGNLSDERLKDYQDVSTKIKYMNPDKCKRLKWTEVSDESLKNVSSESATSAEAPKEDVNTSFSEWKAKLGNAMIEKIKNSRGYQPQQAATFNGNPGITMGGH